MSVATQVTTFSDLYVDLQNKLRQQTGVSATENVAKRAINTALHDIMIGYGEKFPWAERTAELLTQPSYTTGTVTISQGSTSLTGSSTAWNTANDFSVNNARVGGKLVIDGSKEVYTVSAVGSDTSITLTSRFVGDDVSAGSYVYFEDEYALASDFLRPISFTSFDTAGEVGLIGRSEFRRKYPRNKTTGKPRIATLLDKAFSGDTTPVRKVQFHQPPDAAYLFPYAYVTSNLAVTASGTEQAQLVNDTDEPIMPLMFRHSIVFHALYNHYRDNKDDTRSQEAKAEYVDIVTRMVGDQEIGSNRPQIRPSVGPYARRAKQPYGARGNKRYVVGDAWDELRE